MSRNFNLSQAASNGITVLPDVTKGLPSVGDVLSVKATTGGVVTTAFAPPGSGGTGAGYLALSGGTMTGPLVLAGDPTTSAQAANRNYVDTFKASVAATYLPLTGGHMGGSLVLFGPPVGGSDATTKTYVDAGDSAVSAVANAAVKRAGDTMTGLLILSGDPATGLGAATKTYVDTKAGAAGIPEAPVDALTYGRASAAWSAVLPLSGGTLAGPLLLNAVPTAPLGAATKGYVDANSFADAPSDGAAYGRRNAAWLSVAPLASPGLLGVPTAPTAAVDTGTGQLATCQFVLAQAANAVPLIEGTGTIGTSTRYARQDHVHPASVTRNTARLQAQWVTGAIVANDTVYLAYDAPYGGTINALTYFTGNGSFTVAIQINGVSVTGLAAVAISSATPATTNATALNTFSPGARITAVITAATGSPTDALLSLAVTWS